MGHLESFQQAQFDDKKALLASGVGGKEGHVYGRGFFVFIPILIVMWFSSCLGYLKIDT